MNAIIRCIGDDVFVVEQKMDWDAVSVRVVVPRREGLRIYSDAEREEIAFRKAQNMAMGFVESLTNPSSPAVSTGTN